MCVLQDITLGQGQTLLGQNKYVEYIQIQYDSKELLPGHRFWLCVPCDLDDVTLSQGHETHLGHGQQLCEISNIAVRSYGLE